MIKYLLLAAFVLPPVLPQAGSVIFAALLAIVAMLRVRSRPWREGWQFGWPFLLLLLPMVYGLFIHPTGDWVRDVALEFKPAFVTMTAVLFGYAVARREGAREIERLLMIGAMISCVVYIVFGTHGRTDTEAWLQTDFLWNRGGFYIWLPAMLLIALRLVLGRGLTWLHLVCAPLLLLSLYLSESRALVVAITLGAGVGIVRAGVRRIRLGRMVAVAGVISLVLAATLVARFDATPGVGEVNELDFSASNFGEENQRWRGFETFTAVSQWASGNPFEMAFGQGMGAQIDLYKPFFLAGRFYESLPQAHNGYATLLVKDGVAGIVCFMLYYFMVMLVAWRTFRIAALERRPAVLAALGAICMVPIMGYTIEGAISPGQFDPTLMFIGAVIGANTSRIRKWRPAPP